MVAMLYKLTAIVDNMLKDEKLTNLDKAWVEAKSRYAGHTSIPRQTEQAMADWAKQNLSPECAQAVIAAVKAMTSKSTPTARIRTLRPTDVTTLLASLVGLVAADFTLHEILTGAMRDTKDAGAAVRHIARQLEGHREELQDNLGKS